mmetsp:Transcript_30478/g.63948  ORF Transcript_30478/g.63948 Transcript_30478/m.63948 type:complete len:328 (-) Transcript_30478:5-988(-)
MARVHRVVSGVVRARRDLVEEHRAVGHGEQFDSEDSRALHRGDRGRGDAHRLRSHRRADVRRRHHRVAHRVALHRLDRRVGGGAPVHIADDHHRQLLGEGTPPLGIKLNNAPRGERAERAGRVRCARDHRVPTSVVRAFAGLEHQRVAPPLPRREHRFHVRSLAEVAHGDGLLPRRRRLQQVLLLEQLVLYERDRGGGGVDLHVARRTHPRQRLCVDVLDLDCDHVDQRRKLGDLRRVGEAAAHSSSADAPCGRIHARRVEDRHRHSQALRCEREHLTQLPTAKHAHTRRVHLRDLLHLVHRGGSGGGKERRGEEPEARDSWRVPCI